jgi:hypothetical protein
MLSPELEESIRKASFENGTDAFTSNRRSKIGSRWLSHGSWYPDKKIRLFNRNKVRVQGFDVHESLVADHGVEVSHLRGDLLHYADEDIAARYQKVNAYSTRAAQGLYYHKKKTSLLRIWVKPCVRFLSAYIFKAGFLDGFYGYVVAKSEAHYVWLREVKLRELHQQNSANLLP